MSRRRTAILVVAVLLLCLVVGALGTLAYLLSIQAPPVEALEERPTILIDSPRQRAEVTVGQEVQIFATGRDPARMARMELWIDGEMVQSQASAFSEGTNPLPLTASWEPPSRGNHTIVVRGYNTASVPGQASIAVNAMQAAQIPDGCDGVHLFDYSVQEGDTLEGIATPYQVSVQQVLACNPGLHSEEPLTPGATVQIPVVVWPEPESPPDWPPPAGAEAPPDLPPSVTDLPGEELPPPEEEPLPGEGAPADVQAAPVPEGVPEPPLSELPPATRLNFEALEFQVDGAYDAVYCLARLADAPLERIPEAEGSSLAPSGATTGTSRQSWPGSTAAWLP